MNEIGIESSLLRDILTGEKTVEGRLGKKRFLKMKPGDKLSLREDIWQDGVIVKSIPERGVITITQLLYFETFEEMLDAVGVQSILPHIESLEEALTMYRQFYSKEDEQEYGVVAILFELN